MSVRSTKKHLLSEQVQFFNDLFNFCDFCVRTSVSSPFMGIGGALSMFLSVSICAFQLTNIIKKLNSAVYERVLNLMIFLRSFLRTDLRRYCHHSRESLCEEVYPQGNHPSV